MSFKKIESIGLVKESITPENPGGLDKRSALTPKDAKVLVDRGCKLYFQEGLGEGIGFSDEDYLKAGAIVEKGDQIFKNKDMLIKIKGPSLENIAEITPGTVLFCMAHLNTFPERAKLLNACKINVIAMEQILESPKHIPDAIIVSKRFVADSLRFQKVEYDELHLNFIGYSEDMVGGIRRAGNRDPKTQCLYQMDVKFEELEYFGESSVYYYDSRVFKNAALIEKLQSLECQLFDFKEYQQTSAKSALDEYRLSHKPFEFGGRRIECLHETGIAGARYGFSVLRSNDRENYSSDKVKVAVMGYGNVGMGAIHECYDKGVRKIQILGRTHTTTNKIGAFVKDANLIINGAEQAPELRGINFLIKKEYIGSLIKPGSVVIDLVGGSASSRSAVEDIMEYNYLHNPNFVRDGVTFSGLWGWPSMGLEKESVERYSSQILDVLTGPENLLNGLGHLTLGVKPALVCGPFGNLT